MSIYLSIPFHSRFQLGRAFGHLRIGKISSSWHSTPPSKAQSPSPCQESHQPGFCWKDGTLELNPLSPHQSLETSLWAKSLDRNPSSGVPRGCWNHSLQGVVFRSFFIHLPISLNHLGGAFNFFSFLFLGGFVVLLPHPFSGKLSNCIIFPKVGSKN